MALFLGLTMLPFAIVAPLIGPFLDRFSHGRRWAIGATMALRAFLCWVLADAVGTGDTVALFPAALGGARGVEGVRRHARGRRTPRAAAASSAWSRPTPGSRWPAVAGRGDLGAAGRAAPRRGGPQWSLRYAFLVFVGAHDPGDPAAGAGRQLDRRGQVVAVTRCGRQKPAAGFPPAVVVALRCNTGLRLLSGFLTMFMAFLLRDEPFPGWEDRPELLLGLVIGSAGLGSTIGIAAGVGAAPHPPRGRRWSSCSSPTPRSPWSRRCSTGCRPRCSLGLTAGLAQSLGKLSLDALIQREVPERDRAGAFARSETLLQLSWVSAASSGSPCRWSPGSASASAAAFCWSGCSSCCVGARCCASASHVVRASLGHLAALGLPSSREPLAHSRREAVVHSGDLGAGGAGVVRAPARRRARAAAWRSAWRSSRRGADRAR